MRIAPLIALIVFIVLVASTLGTVFIWIVAGISFLALVALLVFMARQGQFMGPKVLFQEEEKEEIDLIVVDTSADVQSLPRKDKDNG